MFWARALTATTLLGVLLVVSIGTALVPQAFPNRADTAIGQKDTAAAHLAGPARAGEPILLALQTAVPAADPKAGEPVIDEKAEVQLSWAWTGSSASKQTTAPLAWETSKAE